MFLFFTAMIKVVIEIAWGFMEVATLIIVNASDFLHINGLTFVVATIISIVALLLWLSKYEAVNA